MEFFFFFFFLMIRRRPISTLTATLFPYTTLIRSPHRRLFQGLDSRPARRRALTPPDSVRRVRTARDRCCAIGVRKSAKEGGTRERGADIALDPSVSQEDLMRVVSGKSECVRDVPGGLRIITHNKKT